MCRNWAGGPNLQCLVAPGGSVQQCLCTPAQYFDYCADVCYTARSWQQSCNTSTCYATNNMCDQSRSLTCINNICNCSITQWWNGTTCQPKGNSRHDLPMWKSIFFRSICRNLLSRVCDQSELSVPRVQSSILRCFSMPVWINDVLVDIVEPMLTKKEQRWHMCVNERMHHCCRSWFELHQWDLPMFDRLYVEFCHSTVRSSWLSFLLNLPNEIWCCQKTCTEIRLSIYFFHFGFSMHRQWTIGFSMFRFDDELDSDQSATKDIEKVALLPNDSIEGSLPFIIEKRERACLLATIVGQMCSNDFVHEGDERKDGGPHFITCMLVRFHSKHPVMGREVEEQRTKWRNWRTNT